MRLNLRATTAIVSALPSCRVLLLAGAVLVMSESLALATTLFAASALSFAASLLLAAKLYRSTTPQRSALDRARRRGKPARLV